MTPLSIPEAAPFVFEALVPGAYPHPSVSDKKASYFSSQTLAHFHPTAKRWEDAQTCDLQTPQPFLLESSMLGLTAAHALSSSALLSHRPYRDWRDLPSKPCPFAFQGYL